MFFLALFLISWSSVSFAQKSDVLILAERLPKNATTSAFSATHWTREDMQLIPGQSLSEKFESLSGLTVSRSGGISGAGTLFIRGLSRGQTQFLFEGFKLKDSSDIDSNFQFQHLSDSLYGGYEILRGGGSHIAGSEAMGGIVSLKSSEQTFAGLSYGSFSTTKSYGNFHKNWSDESLTLSLESVSSDGESVFNEKRLDNAENDRSEKLNGHIIYKKFLSDSMLSILFKKTQSQYEIDEGFPLIDTRDDDLVTFSHNLLGIKYEKELKSNMLLNVKGSQQLGQRNSTGDEFSSIDREVIAELLIKENPHHFSLFFEVADSRASVENNFKESRSQGSIASDYFYKLNDFFFELNGRGDFYEKHEDALTYRLAIGQKVSKMNLKLSHRRGFKAPSLYQLYSNYGNSELSPIKMNAYDFNINIPSKFLTFNQSFFYIKIFEDIDYINSLSRYQNTGERESLGSETKLALNTFGTQTEISYTYQVPREDSELISRVPKKIFKVKVSKKYNDWSFLLLGKYIGEREDGGRMPSFVTFDGSFGREFKSQQRTYLAYFYVKNLFDKNYELIRRYGGTARSFALTAEVTF